MVENKDLYNDVHIKNITKCENNICFYMNEAGGEDVSARFVVAEDMKPSVE